MVIVPASAVAGACSAACAGASAGAASINERTAMWMRMDET
jgi:hypothetical protein